MYIDGKFVDATDGKTFDVYDPSTEGVIATCPAGGAKDIDRAAQAAYRAFYDGWRTRQRAGAGPSPVPAGRADPRPAGRAGASWRRSTPGSRSSSPSTTWTTRPPASSTTAGSPPRSTARSCRSPPTRSPWRCGSRWASPGRSFPWNYPLIMAAWKIAPALAAGCTVRAQAGGADAAQHPEAGRGLRGGRTAAGRGEHRHRRRSRCGRAAGGASRRSARSPSPAAPRSASSSCGTRPTSSSGSRSSWAASRPTSSSATPTSRTRWTAPCSAPSSTRARSAPPGAACWCRRTSTRSSWTPRRRRRRPSGSAPAWTARPRWVRW